MPFFIPALYAAGAVALTFLVSGCSKDKKGKPTKEEHKRQWDQYCNSVKPSTPSTHHHFKVLAQIEQGTWDRAVAKGWNVKETVQSHIKALNKTFNNGQLVGTFEFELLDIQTRPPQASYKHYSRPSIKDTPEDEDYLLIYDKNYSINNSGRNTILLETVGFLSPHNDHLQRTVAHEFGHGRGTIDLGHLEILGDQNEVFPGAAYLWPGRSIMGTSKNRTEGLTWDPLSIELIRISGTNPKIDSMRCDEHWYPKWVPKTVKIKVTDSAGAPAPNAEVKIYRVLKNGNYPKIKNSLKKDDLWFTGVTDEKGILELPKGLTTRPKDAKRNHPFFFIFLAAVNIGGKDYLNWYNVIDIALPYLKGKTQLTLEAKADRNTQYKPNGDSTDISVESVSIAPLSTSPSIMPGIPFERRVTVRNSGPEPFSGVIGLSFYFSSDRKLDPKTDYHIDYTIKGSRLGVGDTEELKLRRTTLSSKIPPGKYYTLVQLKPGREGWVDPDESNNIGISEQFTVKPFRFIRPK